MCSYQVDIKFIDASKWEQLSWHASGGTRAKKILQDANGKQFYLKYSAKTLSKDNKPEKYYRYEFYNEIIAYQLGKSLGLDILRYDIALFDNELGCISPNMTVIDDTNLIEVGKFMIAINQDFEPDKTETRKQYTFQLLMETLQKFELEKFNNFFFETLLFDAVIGNTDRHQENWAFIGKPNTAFVHDPNYYKTAPIYDNGSSLARELTDESVNGLLNNEQDLEKYIAGGKSELHWKGQKISHFDLVEKMLADPVYNEQLKDASVFIEKFDEAIIQNIMLEIDEVIPCNMKSHCIPKERKALIIKLLTLRIAKLRAILKNNK
ncbi:MAG: HipA domain-containing protein [Phycisphaerales bacterium]|nr:HipA domain-containing protein [Phycisphaerales bacterium]